MIPENCECAVFCGRGVAGHLSCGDGNRFSRNQLAKRFELSEDNCILLVLGCWLDMVRQICSSGPIGFKTSDLVPDLYSVTCIGPQEGTHLVTHVVQIDLSSRFSRQEARHL